MKFLTFALIFTTVALSASAQTSNNRKKINYYNPHQAEAEYYREFNRRTEHLYRTAKTIRDGARYATRINPRVGRTYRAADRQIQRHVQLPRRYRY